MTATITPKKTVTVYTKDDCRQCVATKKWLTARSIEFAEVDILDDPKDLEAAKELGFLAAPVVVVSFGTPKDDVYWAGFNPSKLTEHVTTATPTETSTN